MKRLVKAYAQHFATWLMAGETDLLALAQLVGGLAFKTKREQEWFKRRFTMFQDILRESWVYQEIGQQFLEEGRKEGREEGREEERQRRAEGQRELLMSFVQAHFPEITVLAKQQAERITDPEVLQHVIIKLLAAQGLDEAKRILLDVNKGENRH